MASQTRFVRAGVLDIAYEEHGAADGHPVVLSHGFPYDVHAFDDVVARLNLHRMRIIVPHLRGFGATRFVDAATMRSGQQAAIGEDLLALLDALRIERAIVAGFDWGARAACIVAALHPERVTGLVCTAGYNIQDIASAIEPGDPESESKLWYQYYLHGERGYRALAERGAELAKFLWRAWSPAWKFSDETFARSAPAFDNPDFADVCAHSYRHRFGYVAGDPRYAAIEEALAKQPRITVPSISFFGDTDGIRPPPTSASEAVHFGEHYEHVILERIGHNVPQEAPEQFAAAIARLTISR